MGGGEWTAEAYSTYTKSYRGMDATTYSTSTVGAQEVFRLRSLDAMLNPYKVIRECADSAEHPKTFPVILALDVTGSMGPTAAKVAKSLGIIMSDLYADDSIQDIEFCVMAIGDLYCDRAPVQMSQFESDVRIAEQLDKIWFEGGGGANKWESYTAVWYMGARHCKLDCWGRGGKGVIITIGDEQINPVLQKDYITKYIGDSMQADIETADLYAEAKEKFDIFHISVDDAENSYRRNNRSPAGILDDSWQSVIGQNYRVSTLNGLAKTITDIVIESYSGDAVSTFASDGISW